MTVPVATTTHTSDLPDPESESHVKDDVLRQMDELGCPAPLRRLIERLPDDVRLVVKPGVGDFLPLAVGNDCVAGIYMNVPHLHLLLTPSDARRVADDTGCKLVKSNQATGYVRVLPDEAVAHEDVLAEAVERALRRSAGRRGAEPNEDHRLFAGRRPQRTCPDSFELVPASGICERHGATCS
jgi:hypothetical protein